MSIRSTLHSLPATSKISVGQFYQSLIPLSLLHVKYNLFLQLFPIWHVLYSATLSPKLCLFVFSFMKVVIQKVVLKLQMRSVWSRGKHGYVIIASFDIFAMEFWMYLKIAFIFLKPDHSANLREVCSRKARRSHTHCSNTKIAISRTPSVNIEIAASSSFFFFLQFWTRLMFSTLTRHHHLR